MFAAFKNPGRTGCRQKLSSLRQRWEEYNVLCWWSTTQIVPKSQDVETFRAERSHLLRYFFYHQAVIRRGLGTVARDNSPPEAMSLEAKMQELRLLLFHPISEELKVTAIKLSAEAYLWKTKVSRLKSWWKGEIFSCGHLRMKQIVWTLEGR